MSAVPADVLRFPESYVKKAGWVAHAARCAEPGRSVDHGNAVRGRASRVMRMTSSSLL